MINLKNLFVFCLFFGLFVSALYACEKEMEHEEIRMSMYNFELEKDQWKKN